MTEISANEVYEVAKAIKTYVEKNYKLPGSIKTSKSKYTYQEAAYILSRAVLNPGDKIAILKGIKAAPKPTGETVNLTLKIADYKKVAKNVSEFIAKKTNRRLPNYTTYNGKKIKQRVFIYAFAKIIVFYNKNNRLPNLCGFKTSETVKQVTTKKKTGKYGHATKQGCDNMGQNTSYYCGCHSLQEVFRNLTGKVVPQSTIASVAGTTTSGTDHGGLNTAVAWFNKKYGYNLSVEWKNFSDLGWSGMKKIINSSNQDCVIHNLYRNQWGHYEVINNVSDSNIKVQNSLGSKCTSSCYCGYVEDRTPAAFRSYIAGISQKSVMIITRK